MIKNKCENRNESKYTDNIIHYMINILVSKQIFDYSICIISKNAQIIRINKN